MIWLILLIVPFSVVEASEYFCCQRYSDSMHEVEAIGAATAGGVIEGIAGAPYQDPHHRYSCHTLGPKPGCIGPDVAGKATSVKDQPGVYPAPLLGPDSLQFAFLSDEEQGPFLATPVVVRPDGTLLFGKAMGHTDNLFQVLEIPAPAQQGIYTLFLLPLQHQDNPISVSVQVTLNGKSMTSKVIALKLFINDQGNDSDVCGEYIYLLRHKT